MAETFYTPFAASQVVGLTPEKLIRLCEKLDCPVAVTRIPSREHEGVGTGCILIPAQVLRRFGTMLDEMDSRMLVRLSGELDGEEGAE